MRENPFRQLPAVHELLQTPRAQRLSGQFSSHVVVQALRASINRAREEMRAGASCPSPDMLLESAEQMVQEQQRPRLRPVINATGVIINTNLGRAPLSMDALDAVREVASGYANLEYDLEAGERGSRHGHIGQLLRDLTGAEAALVTNNNAAAVLLSLSALAVGREVVISRGQLVEIGGGFRVPDVMRQSGCQLIEVGTTNRTRRADYEAAISEQSALLLAVHPSNFLITGFTESTPLHELVQLAHERGLLVMEDLGSGCLLDCEKYGLTHEPTVRESVQAGVDLICFSGDKLLGGPQAGILAGKKEVIARLAKHPLLRAIRVDKMTLAALEATLRHYQRGQVETHIPVWRMIAATVQRLEYRVATWKAELAESGIQAQSIVGESTIGGGSLPGETLPTRLLGFNASEVPGGLEELARRLRRYRIPVVTRIMRDRLLLDPRTVLEEQDRDVLQALREAIGR